MYNSHCISTCEVVTMIMLFAFLPLFQPDLAEGEEGINQEIMTLKEKLYQQVATNTFLIFLYDFAVFKYKMLKFCMDLLPYLFFIVFLLEELFCLKEKSSF